MVLFAVVICNGAVDSGPIVNEPIPCATPIFLSVSSIKSRPLTYPETSNTYILSL